jgi:hypothetical protein
MTPFTAYAYHLCDATYDPFQGNYCGIYKDLRAEFQGTISYGKLARKLISSGEMLHLASKI